MSFKSLFSVTIFLVFVLFTAISCQKENDEGYNYFLIQVDSISAPDTVEANDTFEIAFWGLVGTNGCYQFFEFSVDKQENEIVIEAWGKIKKDAQFCTDEMVYLRGREMNYSISEPGQYLIKVSKSGNSYLEHTILVTE
jgi:hypothetical protein